MTSATEYATTGDGWRLALTRFPAQGAARGPVLLCHGLGSNRHSFDFSDDVSLARWLAGRGWDVWCLELRGYGLSQKAPFFGYDWSFDTLLEQDVPAAIRHVRERCGGAPVRFVGHSMGGILLLAHLASGKDGIAAGVAIGSSLDYTNSGSGFETLARLKAITRFIPFLPLKAMAFLGSPLMARWHGPIDEFNIWVPNVFGPHYRSFIRRGAENVAPPLLHQLATAFEPGGLRALDGRRYFEGLPGVKTPVLMLAGDRDRQCPLPAAVRSFDALGSKDKSLVPFGRGYGQADHYGHVDLVAGRRAPQEVYPVIASWLEAR